MRSSALLVLLSAASPAFSSVLAPLEAIRRGMAQLEHRQAPSSSFDLSFTGVQGNTATTTSSSSSGSASGSATTTGSGTSGSGSSSSGSSSGSGSASSSGNNTASTQTFDDRLPAGGVQMVTPAPTAQASYYKIGNYATFAWNYTSLSITPSAIDVLATCTLNQATYTIAQNLTVSNATQAVTWDTGAYQKTASVPLLTETYTLIIHDAAQDVSATAKAGYLATYNQFVFGMYVPQPYTPIAQWTCATCNSALSAMERQTLGFVFSMAIVTILSFGWFGNLFGLF